MSIPANVFDRQHAQRDSDEIYNNSRNLATPSGIADVEDSEKQGIEKNGSEEPLPPMPLPNCSGKAQEKVWTTAIVLSL